MGFGSYDESEQREPEFADEDDEEDVDRHHEHDHEGTLSFESGASTDDLVDRLGDIIEDAEEE